MPTQNHLFISYGRGDRAYVTKLAQWLNGHGVWTWFDRDIAHGEKWESELYKQLDNSAAVLVVMSESARGSKWVDREIDRAEQRQTPIFPILLEPNCMLNRLAHLQLDNVVGARMPSLRLCQMLPGFLVSEQDLANALNPEQRAVAERISSAVGGGLRRGSKGPAVAALQVELLRVGLDPGSINGVFGAKTANAVKAFQARRCHVPTADGMVGRLTWMILANSSLGDLSP